MGIYGVLRLFNFLPLCRALSRYFKRKNRLLKRAEREGFEPPVPCGTAVFKTAAIGHSATSPGLCKIF